MRDHNHERGDKHLMPWGWDHIVPYGGFTRFIPDHGFAMMPERRKAQGLIP